VRDRPAAVPVPPAQEEDTVGGTTLRRVLSSFATGVTVVTVAGPDPHAMTANSFTSVSLDPPLVLICVDRRAFMHDRILAAGAFAVSVLCAEQEAVARRFADRTRGIGAAQFDGIGTFPGRHTRAPLISGALAWVECAIWRAYDGGDHTVVLGRLLAAHDRTAQQALIFLRGRYARLP
jgi:flavin reductase (DIM6/NTAB) family NADH-FMN oxidoreductase RutF